MPAVSKKQQRFFGMVRAAQKGEMDSPSPEVSKAASSMSKSDVKKFASTKHKGLPMKKKTYEQFTTENMRLDKKGMENPLKEDSMRKDESLTKRRIQDLTLKHQARRLEIPGGHPSALE